jgi:hypothetical protein
MYRNGLTRARIAGAENVPTSTVGYHLSVARAQDPGLQDAHEEASRSPAARVTVRTMQRMNDLIEMVRTEGRYPSSKAGRAQERSLASWLQRRRRDAAEGRLAPEVRDGLACLPGWPGTPRAAAEEERWQQRLTELTAYRAAGHDWPRHKKTITGTEHDLGIWLHTQRYKQRRGDLHPAKKKALDAAVPGWSAGRTRGRKARPAPDRQGSRV